MAMAMTNALAGLEGVEANLREIVARAQVGGARVLLLGMHLPTNYGPDYTGEFHDLYRRVAEDTGASVLAGFLEGVGGRPSMNLEDGLHPNARGHERLADNVLPALRPLLPE